MKNKGNKKRRSEGALNRFHLQNLRLDVSPFLIIAVTTLVTIAISIYFLSSGYFNIFPNLFYIPIIIACIYYKKRGFIFSVIVACIYFLLTLVFTRESSILLEAFVMVLIFVLVAGIVSYLSSVRNRAGEALQQSEERFRQMVDLLPEAVCEFDTAGNILFGNRAAFIMVGYDEADFEKGLNILPMIAPEDQDRAFTNIQRMMAGEALGADEYTLVRKDGSRFSATVHIANILNISGKTLGFRGIIVDITERKRAERYQELAAEILGILSESVALTDAISRILAAIERGTGIDAVGIRLRKDDDFPYFVQSGFSQDFLLTENTLVARGPDGGMCRDKDGNVSLECTCGLVLSGKTDPSNPLFTLGGSAWTNDSLSLLDIPLDKDPRLHPRNRCIHAGFKSVALIPIRANKEIVGLLQLNDRRKGCFTLEAIRFFEGIAESVGVALMRKQTEEAQQRLAAIVASSHDAIIGKTLDGIITSWNKGAEEHYGYSAAEVVGRPISILIPPERADEMPQFLTKVGRGEAVIDYEAERITKDGRRVTVLLTISPIKDTSGKIVGASTIAQDITERKRFEEMLKESEQKFRELADLLPQTICEIDLHGRFTYANRYGIEAHGYTKEEIEKSLNALDLFIPAQRDRATQNISRVLSGQKFDDHEYSVLRKNGSMYPALIYTNAIVRNSQVVGVRALIVDITERKKIEQMKTDFVSFISHQMRTPVAGLMAYIDNMLEGITGELNSKQIDYLSEMRDVCARNNRLIADLLNISRLERGVLAVNINPVDLRSVVDLAVKEHRKAIEEKGLALNIKEAEKGIVVLADNDKLIEVLKNVIHNATKFTRTGSINIEMMTDGDRGIIKVRDTGVGMTEEVMMNLFSKEKVMSGAIAAGGGAGLGLYIAKGFMQLQHGDITAESIVGKGSIFIISLPRK